MTTIDETRPIYDLAWFGSPNDPLSEEDEDRETYLATHLARARDRIAGDDALIDSLRTALDAALDQADEYARHIADRALEDSKVATSVLVDCPACHAHVGVVATVLPDGTPRLAVSSARADIEHLEVRP